MTKRLEWAARFASAVSHEVGNIVLFAEASDPDAPPSEEVRVYREQYSSIVQHFRQLLRALALWKSNDVQRGKNSSVTEWWRSQGGFLRQFVRRSVPVTLASSAAGVGEVDAALLTRVVAALLIAIEEQVAKLERITIEAATEADHPQRVCLAIKITPTIDFKSFIVPALVTKSLGGESQISCNYDRHTERIVVGIKATQHRPTAAGTDGHLFP